MYYFYSIYIELYWYIVHEMTITPSHVYISLGCLGEEAKKSSEIMTQISMISMCPQQNFPTTPAMAGVSMGFPHLVVSWRCSWYLWPTPCAAWMALMLSSTGWLVEQHRLCWFHMEIVLTKKNCLQPWFTGRKQENAAKQVQYQCPTCEGGTLAICCFFSHCIENFWVK